MAVRGVDPLSTVKLLSMGLAFLMFAGGGYIAWARLKVWNNTAIQVFGLVLLIPTILALAVTRSLSTEILATLLGGVAGYIFGRGTGGDSGGQPRL